MHRGCILTAVHPDPFLSYGTQWWNVSANVGCFIAGVCGLQCMSVHLIVNNRCPTVIQASVWDAEMCRTTAFSCNRLWTNFAADREGALSSLHVVFDSLWKVEAGEGGAHYELREPVRSKLKRKSILFVWNHKLKLIDFYSLVIIIGLFFMFFVLVDVCLVMSCSYALVRFRYNNHSARVRKHHDLS